MVLKSSIRTLALPRRQQSKWGLRLTQNAYFSLIAHTKQLLLVTYCDKTAGSGVRFLQAYHKMSLIKVVWYVLRVKSLHPGSPSHPSQTAAAEEKLRCVYLILKPHGHSSRSPVRPLLHIRFHHFDTLKL